MERALILSHIFCSLCKIGPETPLLISIHSLFQNYLLFVKFCQQLLVVVDTMMSKTDLVLNLREFTL